MEGVLPRQDVLSYEYMKESLLSLVEDGLIEYEQGMIDV